MERALQQEPLHPDRPTMGHGYLDDPRPNVVRHLVIRHGDPDTDGEVATSDGPSEMTARAAVARTTAERSPRAGTTAREASGRPSAPRRMTASRRSSASADESLARSRSTCL
jgi:hypothetical protein